MRIVKNAVSILSIAIIVAAAAMFVLHIKPAVVMSGSMEPEIKTGSLVLIDTRDRDIEKGDVIAFASDGILVTHRAVRKTEEGWITKGDNNNCEDLRKVCDRDIKGTVTVWIPYVGYPIGNIRRLIT